VPHRIGLVAWISCSVVLTALPARAHLATLDLEVVALTGDAAPGTEATYVAFRAPVLDEAGGLAFAASLGRAEDGALIDNGFWLRRVDGELEVIAREGEPAVGASAGELWSSLDVPRLWPEGSLAFPAAIVDAEGNYDYDTGAGIWTLDPEAGLALLIRSGDPISDSDPTPVSYLGVPMLEDGRAVFRVATQSVGAAASRLLVREADGTRRIVAKGGELAPGTSGDVRFGASFPLCFGADGSIHFAANLQIDGARIESGRAVYREAPGGALELLLASEDAAPIAAPALFGFQNTVCDAEGRLALVGIGAPEHPDDTGVYVAAAGDSPIAVARRGSEAPGTEARAFYWFEEVALDADGGVVFRARLASELTDGLWGADAAGTVFPYQVPGAGAAGLPDGVVVSAVGGFASNRGGDVLFPVGLTGPGVWWYQNDGALFFAPRGRGPTLVLRTGETLEVGPGDLRTIQGLGSVSTSLGFSSLDSARRIALAIDFTDGSSGVFVGQVPEPSRDLAAVTALASLVAAALRVRRR